MPLNKYQHGGNTPQKGRRMLETITEIDTIKQLVNLGVLSKFGTCWETATYLSKKADHVFYIATQGGRRLFVIEAHPKSGEVLLVKTTDFDIILKLLEG